MLLILAGVAINLSVGSNGIFTRAQNVVDRYEIAEKGEQDELNKVVNFIDDYMNGNGGSNTGDEPKEPEKDYNTGKTVEEAREQNTPYKETTTIKDDNEKDVTIPKNFGVHPDSNIVVDEGIVITDGTNEFVWVPVDDPSTMFEEKTAKLTGVETTTNIYSKLRVRNGDSYSSGIPGTSGIREPDVLSEYDTDERYYKDILGFNSIKEMADSMVAEYKAMSDSVKKYHGFYIGRYELTGTVENPTEKSDYPLMNEDYYNLYKACQNVIKNNSDVMSTMIYGCQWDETCSWLEKNGYNTDLNSSSWGNYNMPPIKTGSDSRYKANEIYDLAGNFYERTQEAFDTYLRMIRGGYFESSGSEHPASSRFNIYPNDNGMYFTTRATLYIF